MSIKRLWNVAPIRSTSLNVPASMNQELARVALDSLEAYSNLGQQSKTQSSPRRSRRIRTRPTPTNRSPGIQSTRSDPQQAPHHIHQDGSGLSLNDYFFEHQRLHGYTTGTPILNQSQALSNLQKLLVTQVETYLTSLQHSSASHAISLLQQGILSLDVWAAIQRGKGSYHKTHVHDGALVSGVYYVSVPAGSAPLILYKPQEDPPTGSMGSHHHNDNDKDAPKPMILEEAIQESNCQSEKVLFFPSEGHVILFPPWLPHGVPTAAAKEDSCCLSPRVSFAFNLTGAHPGDPWHVAR